jgi:hypothetical protein
MDIGSGAHEAEAHEADRGPAGQTAQARIRHHAVMQIMKIGNT